MRCTWCARPCVRCASHSFCLHCCANGTDDGKSLFVTYGQFPLKWELFHQIKWHRVYVTLAFVEYERFLLAATAVNTLHRLTIGLPSITRVLSTLFSPLNYLLNSRKWCTISHKNLLRISLATRSTVSKTCTQFEFHLKKKRILNAQVWRFQNNIVRACNQWNGQNKAKMLLLKWIYACEMAEDRFQVHTL